jgi:hypothetical protein
LRRVLARYRGGSFETDGGGGAGGMMFFRNRQDQLFYIGGFNPADADQIATALNLVLELLEPELKTGNNFADREGGETR